MSSVQGRFTSVDPLYFQATMSTDPQRFNLYTYSRNNPTKWTDPTGERLFLKGNAQWIIDNVLDPLTGGHFYDYFDVVDGEVIPKDAALKGAFDNGWDNLGILHVLELVASNDNYVFYAGSSSDGMEVAGLFQGTTTTDKHGKKKLTDAGKNTVNFFTCNGYNSGCGTRIGTTGRNGTDQPVNLVNGDPVFAVIAYNTNTVQTQTSVAYPTGTTEAERASLDADVGGAQSEGLNKRVHPASFFYHESAENLIFRERGDVNNYNPAHHEAMRREAAIRRDLGFTGGFSGGGLTTTVPKK